MGPAMAPAEVATALKAGTLLQLRLYVAGNAPNSLRAIANARAVCAEHFAAHHELEIVDVLRFPKRGLADGIIVTPTLVRVLPLPTQRMIGTLADPQQLLETLSAP
jgi:circadian clock protein KaiB